MQQMEMCQWSVQRFSFLFYKIFLIKGFSRQRLSLIFPKERWKDAVVK